MPINMFFIVKNHWEPSFKDNPRACHCIRLFIQFAYVLLQIANKMRLQKEILLSATVA
jgi:hypothetical protein